MEWLAGKYRVLGTLGKGGQGRVLEVEHGRLHGRRYAAKILDRPDDSGELMQRMVREAQIAASLEHPGIVGIHDVEEDPTHGIVVVMERLHGTPLDAVGRLTLGQARRVLVEVLDALDAAHRAGVVHRDIKPSNLFAARGPDGEAIRILDFGLARMDGGDLTQEGQVWLTPRFASPEHLRGLDQVGPGSDLYSLGATILDLATDVDPPQLHRLDGGQLSQRLDRSRLPPDWRTFLLRAMAHDPARRFASAATMGQSARALSGADDRALIEAVSSGPAEPPPTIAEPFPPTRTREQPAGAVPRSRVWSPGLAALGAAVAIATVWLLLPSPPGPDAQLACQRLAGVLIDNQAEGGGFPGIVHAAPAPWDTAQQLTALGAARSCGQIDEAAIRRGWEWFDGALPAAGPTPSVVHSWALAGRPSRSDEALAALEPYTTDAGVAWFAGDEANPYATVLAGWASARAGEPAALSVPILATPVVAGLEEQAVFVAVESGIADPEWLIERAASIVARCDLVDGACRTAPHTKGRLSYTADGETHPIAAQWLPWMTRVSHRLLEEAVVAEHHEALRAMRDWGVAQLAAEHVAGLAPWQVAEHLLVLAEVQQP